MNMDDGLNLDVDCGWIEEIINAIPIVKSTSYHENLYFSPQDKAMYLKLFSTIVLRSNVMNSKFKSSTEVATSSDVESFFKSLKYGILKQKMYPANEFLDHYIEFVNAEVKLSAIPNVKGPGIEKPKRSKSLEEKSSNSLGNFFFALILYV